MADNGAGRRDARRQEQGRRATAYWAGLAEAAKADRRGERAVAQHGEGGTGRRESCGGTISESVAFPPQVGRRA